ncbi:MFS transporter [Streptomyces sp. NPDC056656]|uniref:MFS transporter n=1 Tax=Streptomyces sp. NPDC056656 TaxID=3345895 RepID=UPI00367B4DC8
MDLDARRWRQSLTVLFFLPGLGLSSWVTRTPDIRDRLDASTAEMGLVFSGLAAGSMIGILASSPLVRRMASRRVIALGTSFVAVGIGTAGGGTFLSSGLVVTTGVAVFGTGMGIVEFAVNIDGVTLEHATGSSVLPAVHGCFSLGIVTGSLIGLVASVLGLGVQSHLGTMALVVIVALLYAIRAVPPGNGREQGRSASSRPGFRTARGLWKDTRLLLIGLVMLTMALAEGAANDWLPLLMVDAHRHDDTLASLAYTAFAAAETLGRFSAGLLVERFGRTAVLRAGAAATAAGIAPVALSDSTLLVGVGVLLWGAGASIGFPVALSAAGDSGPEQAARVSLIATIGYSAFLAGPPVLGVIGNHHGLRAALLIVLGSVVVAIFAVPAIGERREPDTGPTSGQPSRLAAEGESDRPSSAG